MFFSAEENEFILKVMLCGNTKEEQTKETKKLIHGVKATLMEIH
jgi:hypothetical protein